MNEDKERLDSKINRYHEESKRNTSSSSSEGTEQFTKFVEKYQRYCTLCNSVKFPVGFACWRVGRFKMV